VVSFGNIHVVKRGVSLAYHMFMLIHTLIRHNLIELTMIS
jgi:hypothetical protein